MTGRRFVISLLTVAVLACTASLDAATPQSADVETVIARAVAIVLERQEGPDRREWPYEGVYRVRGKIPIGYRIGGTALCGLMLLHAPEAGDDARDPALRRATEFIIEGPHQPLMAHAFEATYDVRGWGYTYGLAYLLALKRADAVPADLAAPVEAAIRFFLDGIAATEIPERGGWNYARRAGFDAPGAQAPFMTGPTLMTLFTAAAAGYPVDPAMIARGLDALEGGRTEAGGFRYSGDRGRDAVPGAVGRMLVAETTLHLAGRADLSRVRGAIDAFFTHWNRLEERRAKTGTHARPFGVAPYYFFYAHHYAGVAIELLPERERPEYRRRLRETLLGIRGEDGSWNDRVFDRSASYGTALAAMALTAEQRPPPARWSGE